MPELRRYTRVGWTRPLQGRFRKALELNPAYPQSTRSSSAGSHLAQSHPQQALAEMDREPEPIWRLYGQALANHALGRKQGSRRRSGRTDREAYGDRRPCSRSPACTRSAGTPTGRSSGWSGPEHASATPASSG